MVVLAASVTTKHGKVLFSRQFVDITQARIESLLAAFPKLRDSLGDTSKQHTLIETTSVRYLYQKIEELFLVVITSKSSNIVEDLATLQVLSRVVPEYCGHVTEKTVVKNGFELIFAFDEVVALGYRESVSNIEQIRTFTNMDSQDEISFERQQKHQEREAKEILKRKMKEIERERRERERMGLPAFSGPSSKSYGGYGGSDYNAGGGGGGSGISSASSYNTGGDRSLTAGGNSSWSPQNDYKSKDTEKKTTRRGLVLGKKETTSSILDQLKKEGELGQDSSSVKEERAKPEVPSEPLEIEIQEQLQCVFDKDGGLTSLDIMGLFAVNAVAEEATRIQLIVSAPSDVQFRVHPNIDRDLFNSKNVIALKDRTKAYPLQAPIHVLKWRHQSTDDRDVPLRVGCWPTSGQGGITLITLEYELGQGRPYELSDVTLRIPIRCKDSPSVSCESGSYSYDKNSDTLEWSIPLISADNATGNLEIKAQQWDDNGDLGWMFPVTVTYSSSVTFCPLMVQSALAPNGEDVPFSLKESLVVNKFTVG